MKKNYLLFYPKQNIKHKKYNKVISLGSWVYFSDNYFSKDKNKFCNYYLKYSKKEIQLNYDYLISLNERVLNQLSKTLNRIHSKNEPIEYWRILIGPWVKNFLQVTYDRWNLISKVSNKFKHVSYHEYVDNYNDGISKETNDFTFFSSHDIWNSILISKILKYNSKFFNLGKIKLRYNSNDTYKSTSIKINIIKKLLFNTLGVFKSFSKIILYNTYLGLTNEMKIYLCIKQFPYFNFIQGLSKKDNIIKAKRNIILNIKANNNFEKFLEKTIIDYIPKCFVESLNDYEKKSLKIFPSRAKICISSVAQHGDELFKFFIANNIRNLHFIILQHGIMGLYLFDYNVYTEVKNADFFLSWGWKNINKKIIPFYFSKKLIPKKKNNRKILIILYSFTRHSVRTKPSLLQDNNFQLMNDQLELIKSVLSVNEDIKNHVIVRLPHLTIMREYYKIIINKNFPNLKFDEASTNDSFNNSKLVITTFMGTAFLESIYLNIPTIGVWRKGDVLFNNYAEKEIKQLQKNQIIIDNLKDVKNVISNIYMEPSKWWNKKENIVNSFKNKFCKFSNNINADLEELINNIINNKK
jgi:hypothetical protein